MKGPTSGRRRWTKKTVWAAVVWAAWCGLCLYPPPANSPSVSGVTSSMPDPLLATRGWSGVGEQRCHVEVWSEEAGQAPQTLASTSRVRVLVSPLWSSWLRIRIVV